MSLNLIDPKNLGLRKIQGPKKYFFSQKEIGTKIILGPKKGWFKKCWVQKIMGKNIC